MIRDEAAALVEQALAAAQAAVLPEFAALHYVIASRAGEVVVETH